MMEEQYYADRVKLRQLLQGEAALTTRALMEATERSRSWVKKWRQRLREAQPNDEQVLHGHCRRPNKMAESVSELVVQRILDIRDHPPDHLQRVPGAKTILYYLQRDTALKVLSWVPTGVSTIWRILRREGRIASRPARNHEPFERPPPLLHWQIDFKDISTVRPDPSGDGKRQHVLEALNIVDVGTSILVDFQLHPQFNAETVLAVVAEILERHGVPWRVTCDRDPRFVGSWTGKDFPSAWIRFWRCLGVEVDICPPHRPDKNAFVERYHRTYQQECLAVQRPTTQEQTQQATEAFAHHYNWERPHQGLACANRPPRLAFPQLPALPPLPATVNPDAWLDSVEGCVYVRRLNDKGSFKLNRQSYYVKQALAGQYITLKLDAKTQQIQVEHRGQLIKSVPLKGLHHRILPFQDYVALMCQEAHQEWQRYLSQSGWGHDVLNFPG